MPLSDLPALQHINWNPDRRELGRFAAAMLAGCGIIGGVVAFRAGGVGSAPVALWLTGLALGASAFLPVVDRLVYLAVYVVSGLLGAVVSRVILAAMFAFVFVPLGLFLRLTGKDFLGSRPGASMWRNAESQQDAHSYYRQF
jgi:hypothetical protein